MPTPAAKRAPTYVGPGTARVPARPPMSPDLVAVLASRLRPRDRWLLEILREHRVLTTHQIQQLAFPSISTTTHRLLKLWRLHALERFRPAMEVGSAPMHYVLGPAGAAILAQRRGKTVAQLGYRIDRALAIAHSDKLSHLVGANGLFTALAAHARAHPGTELVTWWSERRCQSVWGKYARPDGYGRWREHHREVDFFTEYDTGTEPLHRLDAKIADYVALAETTGIAGTPVLFILPNPAREQHLHDRITTHRSLIATTTAEVLDAVGGPAGAAWRPIGDRIRRRLIDLGSGSAGGRR
jgi:Replication-relaxation